LEHRDLHRATPADRIRVPGRERANLVGIDLELVLYAGGALSGGAFLGVVGRVLHPLACPGECADVLGGVHAVADDRLDAAEDTRGLALVTHSGDDLGGEHETRVEAACLLDAGRHPGALGQAGELVDDQQREPVARLAGGEVVREVLEDHPCEPGGLLA